MTEQERVDFIKRKGGCRIKNFKTEDITYEMCLAAVSNTGTAIEFIPEQFRTEEVYAIACKTYGDTLKEMPAKYISEAICLDSVKADGLSLQYVPQLYLTDDICFAAVCSNSLAFQYVPEAVLTPAFCVKVVKEKGIEWISSLPKSYRNAAFYSSLVDLMPEIIWNIPRKFRTASLCKLTIKRMGYSSTAAAVKENAALFGLLHPSLYDHDSCLEFVRSSYFLDATKMVLGRGMRASIKENDLEIDGNTIVLNKLLKFYDVCLEAVKANRLILKAMPQELITPELCEISINADGYSFKFVPEKFKTKEMCELAFACYVWNFEDIPDRYKTPQMCLDAVKESGRLLASVPEKMMTHEMCVIAVSDDGSGLKYVPDALFDKEIAQLAIAHSRHSAWILREIPERLRDYDVCLEAIKRDGTNLQYVPANIKDYKLCLTAAQKSSFAAEHIPRELMTPEICLALTRRGFRSLKELPEECLTTEACLEAVKHGSKYGGTVIGDVPRKLITQEMCNTAIEVSVHSLEGIPEEFVTEQILLHVAEQAPGLLGKNFPDRFKTKEFISKMVSKYPDAGRYINSRVLNQKN